MNDDNDNDDGQRSQEHHEQIKEYDGVECCDTIVDEHPQVHAETNIADDDNDEEEVRLDYELQILRKLRLSFISALNMLEVARDDLNHSIPHDIDELRRASERVRSALAKLREQID